MIDTIQRASAEFSSHVAGKTDELMRLCISERLGNEAWLIGDIASRMRRLKIEGQETETYTLDGEPILELGPLQIETVRDGDSTKLVATRKYRTFKK